MSNSERGFGVRLYANTQAYEQAMVKAGASTAAFAGTAVASAAKVEASMVKMGGQLRNVGGMLTRNVSLPLAAAGIAAIKMGADFDASFARMVALAGITGDQVDHLKDSVLSLAGATGVAPKELADALYFASSSGLSAAQAMDAVDRAAHASAAGMGVTKDVVGLVASAIASYGAANIDAARATDILTAAVKVGRADPEQLASSLGSLLPIASQLGISFEQVGGATAFLSNIIGDTATTVTDLKGFMTALIAPGKQAQDMLVSMGTSTAQLQAAISDNGLMGALDLLRSKGFAGNTAAISALFPNVRALAAATALLNDNSGSLASTMDQVKNSVGQTDSAFGTISKTGAFQMKQAWAEIQVALIKAGEVMLPIVADIAQGFGHLASIFADLPAPVQLIIIGLLGLAAAAGPVMVVAGTIMKNFTLLQKGLSNFVKVAEDGSKSLTGLGLTLGVVGAVIATAAIGYSIYAQRKQDAVDRTNDLRGALTGEASAQNQALAALANNDADVKAFLETQKSLGITTAQLTEYVKSGTGPVAALAASWDQARGSSDAIYPQLEALGKLLGIDLSKKGWDVAAASARNFIQEAQAIKASNDGIVATQTLVNDVTGVGTDSTQKLTLAQQQQVDSLAAMVTGTAQVADSTQAAANAKNAATLAAQAQKDAEQALTDSLGRQVTALEDDLKAQMAIVDFARGAADAQYALADATDAFNRDLETQTASLKTIARSKDTEAEKTRKVAELYRQTGSDAAAMGDATVKAFQEASGGTLTHTQQLDIWNHQMLTNAETAKGPARQAILDFISTANSIPADKATWIKAQIDNGDIEGAVKTLDDASKPRTAALQADADQPALDRTKADLDGLQNPRVVPVKADLSAADAALAAWASKYWLTLHPIVSGGGPIKMSAEGRYVDGPMLSTLGEGGKPEVVLPLSNMGRMRALLGDGRVLSPILAAMGFGQSAEGRVVNITHTSIPSSVAAVAVSAAPAAVGNSDSLMANKFERGALSLSEYQAYLNSQMSIEDEFSDRGMQLWRTSEGLKRDQLQQTADAQKAAQDLADANQQREDDRMKYLFDSQQISLADYEAYLASRQGSYEIYSKDWISITETMTQLQDAANKAATDAAAKASTDAAKAAADSIAAIYQQATVAKELFDAQQENGAASAALGTAESGQWLTHVNKKATADEIAAADAAAASAAKSLADAKLRLAKAEAAADGYTEGSVEWAQFVRSVLTGDRDTAVTEGQPALTGAIDQLLLGIPAFATGGMVRSSRFGSLLRAGEAGQDEYVTTGPQLQAVGRLVSAGVGGGSASVYNDNRQIHINGTVLDRPGVARELNEILAEDARRNGRSLARN